MTAVGDERVCPHCGEPPGEGVFCAACGRNLAAVDRLPTRGEWEIAGTADERPLSRPLRRGDRGLPRRDARRR